MEKQVLDHGFVNLIDVMGDDESVVDAARLTQTTEKKARSPAQDEKLIRYLMFHEHMSPFEFVEFKFMIKCPIFVARQWFRHRSSSFNEISGRYAKLDREYYIPGNKQIREQSKTNKQGSANLIDKSDRDYFVRNLSRNTAAAFDCYDESLYINMALETARIGLPLNTYTTFMWKLNLRNLLHFLELRMEEHSQWEIRQYANYIGEVVAEKCPIVWKAFCDYKLNGKKLSAQMIEYIQKNINNKEFPAMSDMDFEHSCFSKREWKYLIGILKNKPREE